MRGQEKITQQRLPHEAPGKFHTGIVWHQFCSRQVRRSETSNFVRHRTAASTAKEVSQSNSSDSMSSITR